MPPALFAAGDVRQGSPPVCVVSAERCAELLSRYAGAGS
jgi:hypothetical protein